MKGGHRLPGRFGGQCPPRRLINGPVGRALPAVGYVSAGSARPTFFPCPASHGLEARATGKQKGPPNLAAHALAANFDEKTSTAHPDILRMTAAKRACKRGLCICMGRLARLAQVQPGFSGRENVDLAQIGIKRQLRIDLKTRLGLHSRDHLVMQACICVYVHVIS